MIVCLFILFDLHGLKHFELYHRMNNKKLVVEKRAVKDYKGCYGSATAKCQVRFVEGEGVFVQEYSFVKSG